MLQVFPRCLPVGPRDAHTVPGPEVGGNSHAWLTQAVCCALEHLGRGRRNSPPPSSDPAGFGSAATSLRASDGAGRDGPARVAGERRRDRARIDEREAPVVERDALREELGTEAVTLAGDRVDAERRRSPSAPGRHRQAGARRGPRTAADRGRVASAANTLRAEATKRAVPSGWWQAPRPGDLSEPAARARPRPPTCAAGQARANSVAIAASPCTAGPALAGALLGEVARDARALAEAAGPLRQDSDGADAEDAAGTAEGRLVQGEARRRHGVEPRAGVAADEDGARLAVGTSRAGNELAEPRSEREPRRPLVAGRRRQR